MYIYNSVFYRILDNIHCILYFHISRSKVQYGFTKLSFKNTAVI